MHETEKPKRGAKMGFLRSCLAFSLYPLIVFKVLVSILVFWAIGGYVKPSLDPQYIPTAEYLLENTQVYEEIPPEVVATEYLTLNITLTHPNLTEGKVCFVIYSGLEEDFSHLSWAEIYINYQVVRRYQWAWDGRIVGTIQSMSELCFNGHLNSGLHIIEFRAKENLFAEPYYIHRWAIEIP
jgi:hypothetical protein